MLKELQSSLNRVQEELAYPDCKEPLSPCVPSPKVDQAKSCSSSSLKSEDKPACGNSTSTESDTQSPSSPCQSCPKNGDDPKEMGPNTSKDPKSTSHVPERKRMVYDAIEDLSPLEELHNFLRQRKGR
jgi:hypothetical protein